MIYRAQDFLLKTATALAINANNPPTITPPGALDQSIPRPGDLDGGLLLLAITLSAQSMDADLVHSSSPFGP